MMDGTATRSSASAIEVLDVLEQGDRLGTGSIWTTRVASGGASSGSLVNADGGDILIRTDGLGNQYTVQAIDQNGAVIRSQAFTAIAGQ
jgi:hypothetical protein